MIRELVHEVGLRGGDLDGGEILAVPAVGVIVGLGGIAWLGGVVEGDTPGGMLGRELKTHLRIRGGMLIVVRFQTSGRSIIGLSRCGVHRDL